MAPFAKLFIVLSISAFQLDVYAAPLAGRASLGNFIQCNVARVKTVKALAASTAAVKKISPDASDNATTSAALITGQAPPADARDQVGQGLNAAQTALSGITLCQDGPAVTSQVSNAQKKVEQTIAAGQQVVGTCGGSGAAGMSSSSVAIVSMTTTEATTAATGTANALEATLITMASDTVTDAGTATSAGTTSVASLTASAV
ncbi:hypothetical protein H0H87_007266 [Tephrocybe sp. NHM501043]|nr:hypothetical protein H0H87_007266 [Tephrocybe sp. NHM501043]